MDRFLPLNLRLTPQLPAQPQGLRRPPLPGLPAHTRGALPVPLAETLAHLERVVREEELDAALTLAFAARYGQ